MDTHYLIEHNILGYQFILLVIRFRSKDLASSHLMAFLNFIFKLKIWNVFKQMSGIKILSLNRKIDWFITDG